GVVALLSQFNYSFARGPSRSLHIAVMGILGLWALFSVACQACLRQGWKADAVRIGWAATDIVLVTALLKILNGIQTTLLVGYPLMIAASGLWFRVRLVWITTLLAELGFIWLYFNQPVESALRAQPPRYPNIFVASLAVTGFVVARQVKR